MELTSRSWQRTFWRDLKMNPLLYIPFLAVILGLLLASGIATPHPTISTNGHTPVDPRTTITSARSKTGSRSRPFSGIAWGFTAHPPYTWARSTSARVKAGCTHSAAIRARLIGLLNTTGKRLTFSVHGAHRPPDMLTTSPPLILTISENALDLPVLF